MQIFALTLLSCVLLAASYPQGAPDSACDSFRPYHVNRANGQPFNSQNDKEAGTGLTELETESETELECPYEILYSSKFSPGETITLNISTRTSTDYFRGYMLSVVDEQKDSRRRDNVVAVGEFSNSSKVICDGSVVTHSDGERRTVEEFLWTAPADSSKKRFKIWVTVVKSFSRYWVNCGSIDLPAIDAVERNTTTPETVQQNFNNNFQLPKEDTSTFNSNKGGSILSGGHGHSHQDHDHDHDHDHNDGKDHQHGEDKGHEDSSSAVDGTDDAGEDDSLVSTSSEDINSVGKDDSGNSDENSIDVSDNRSGSSLNSKEKETRRQKFFSKGIKQFDTDIKKFLGSVGQSQRLDDYGSANAITSTALLVSVMVTVALALTQ